ncbi:alpha/beta fold hydrolase [Bogoriella caseilytica]|nr:alpha/beta hydrolase [Bogoriella caseilytica]
MANFIPLSRSTEYLTVPGGRIAYDIQGDGPLLLLLPGMGELRSSYRHLVPLLVAAGFTVATADLRGHGDSSADFTAYGDVATASDIAALVRHLGAPAAVVGNSMSAGSAVVAAAEHPELFDSLVLVGPFVRNPVNSSVFKRLMFRVLMARPWARTMWNAYLPTLYSGAKPDDFPAYRTSMITAMKRPGYTQAFRLTTRTDHAPAERALPAVQAPTLVVMGEQDPDFADPAAEAAWIAEALNGSVAMIADAGHYPQSQQPEATARAIIQFLGSGQPDA